METLFNKSNFNDDCLEEKKRSKKNLRTKERHNARRKIDAYLERKTLRELLDDMNDLDDFDWDE